MSRGNNIARIAVTGSGIQAQSLTNVPGSVFASAAATSVYPSGTPVQMVSTLAQWYNSLTLNSNWQNIPNMSLSITPKTTTSKLKIEARWFGEVSSAWDVTFGISRGGTVINLPTAEGGRYGCVGMPCQSYVHDDNNSTPELSFISTIDSPNTTNTVTYTMVARCPNGQTLVSGKVYDTGVVGSNYEQGSLEMIITEYLL